MEVDSERMRLRLMPSPVQCLNAIKVRARQALIRLFYTRNKFLRVFYVLDSVPFIDCSPSSVLSGVYLLTAVCGATVLYAPLVGSPYQCSRFLCVCSCSVVVFPFRCRQ